MALTFRYFFRSLLFLAALISGCKEKERLIEVRQKNLVLDQAFQDAWAPPPLEPLSENSATQYALTHNLQIWLASQEEAVQEELRTSACLKLLPELNLSGEHSRRNKFAASSSQDVQTGEESLTASHSTGKETRTVTVSAVWNLLDFGISCMRARQETDRLEIAKQILRRRKQQLAFDVTERYWKAQAAREVAEMATTLGELLTIQKEKLAQQVVRKNISEIKALETELPILNQEHALSRYIYDYGAARSQLARLLGVSSVDDFDLVREDLNKLPSVNLESVKTLEVQALMNRPELYQQDLQHAITAEEAKIALISMFPSPAAFWRYENDKNKLLYFNDWQTVGLTASWSVLSLPQKLYQHKAFEIKVELAEKERLAMAVSVIAQLHLALIEQERTEQLLIKAHEISSKRQRLVEAIESSAQKGQTHSGNVLDMKIKFLMERAAYLGAYSDVMVAKARVRNTIGEDPYIVLINKDESQVIYRSCAPKGPKAEVLPAVVPPASSK